MIFHVKYNEVIVGTVSLLKMNAEFELSKMAVTTDVQGLGIKKINGALHKAAKENQIKRLLFIPTEDWYPPFLCMKIWF
jgi:hypothetical protein